MFTAKELQSQLKKGRKSSYPPSRSLVLKSIKDLYKFLNFQKRSTAVFYISLVHLYSKVSIILIFRSIILKAHMNHWSFLYNFFCARIRLESLSLKKIWLVKKSALLWNEFCIADLWTRNFLQFMFRLTDVDQTLIVEVKVPFRIDCEGFEKCYWINQGLNIFWWLIMTNQFRGIKLCHSWSIRIIWQAQQINQNPIKLFRKVLFSQLPNKKPNSCNQTS